MAKDCIHSCGEVQENAIGEKGLWCEIWDAWRNITLGDCLGNCEDEREEAHD